MDHKRQESGLAKTRSMFVLTANVDPKKVQRIIKQAKTIEYVSNHAARGHWSAVVWSATRSHVPAPAVTPRPSNCACCARLQHTSGGGVS